MSTQLRLPDPEGEILGPDGAVLSRYRDTRWQREEMADSEAVQAMTRVTPAEVMDEPAAGVHGQEYSQGRFGEEHHPDLERREDRIEAFDALRRGDPRVHSELEQIEQPIMQATWSVRHGVGNEPLPSELKRLRESGGDDEDTALQDKQEIAARVLRANIFHQGPRAYRMETVPRQFLHELMTAHWAGFSIFERTWKLVDGPLGKWWVTRRLSWLHPKSITEFYVERDGTFIGIVQRATTQWWDAEAKAYKTASVDVPIPAKDLVLHVHQPEGASTEGGALVRAMYMSAKRAQALRKFRIIDMQRRSVSIPVGSADASASPVNREKAIQILKRLRGGAQDLAWLWEPEGVTFRFLDAGSNAPDVTSALRAEESDIAAVMGTEHRLQGREGQRGGISSAGVQADFFSLRLNAIAYGIAETIDRQVVEPIHAINWPDIPVSSVEVTDVTPVDLEPIIRGVETGILQADGDIEQAYRRANNLPELDQGEVEKRNRRRSLPSLTGEGFGWRTLASVIPQLIAIGYLTHEQGADLLSLATGVGEWADTTKPLLPEKDGEGESARAAEVSEALRVIAPDLGTSEREQVERAVLADAPRAVLARETFRPPTEREARFIALSEIDEKFETFAKSFRVRTRPIYERIARQVAEKLDPKPEGGIVLRGGKGKMGKPLAEAIADAAADMRAFGRAQAELELRKQVAALEGETEELASIFDPPDGADRLRSPGRKSPADVSREAERVIATAVQLDVDQLLDDIIATATRAFSGVIDQGGSEDAAADAVLDALLGTTSTGKDRPAAKLERIGRDVASRAFNRGRAEAVAEAREEVEESDAPVEIEVAVRSEVLDSATCSACSALDGQEFEIDSDAYVDNMPPAKCLGGSNCRGFYDFVVRRA